MEKYEKRCEDLIYDLIKCLRKWGLWYQPTTIFFKNNVYSACCENDCINGFRDLKYVNVSHEQISSEPKCFVANYYNSNRSHDELVPYDIRIEFNAELVDLYGCGFYEVNLNRIAYEKRLEIIERHPELMEEYNADVESMIENPDWYPEIPSVLEFDSADEFIEFRDNYFDEMRIVYIKELDKSVTMDNSAEAEICEIILDADMHYFVNGGEMFIGEDIAL